LSILDFPLGVLVYVFDFVRSWVTSINMSPQLLTFDKNPEMKRLSRVVLAIETNHRNIRLI
jgi:hypothetical protein